LLRSLRGQSRKNVDGVRQAQRATLGYAHRVFAGYRQRLLCVPPAASADPTAIADAEAVRAVLYHGFHTITALLTESFPSVSAEEDTAVVDIVALVRVQESEATSTHERSALGSLNASSWATRSAWGSGLIMKEWISFVV
jgi:hypothetical protein